MTYTFRGKQYVVIAAGGHGKLGTKQIEKVDASKLPEATTESPCFVPSLPWLLRRLRRYCLPRKVDVMGVLATAAAHSSQLIAGF